MVGVGVAVVGADFTPQKPRRNGFCLKGCLGILRLQTIGRGSGSAGRDFSGVASDAPAPGRMESAPAAKVPRGIGPERIGPQGRFGHRSSSPASAARRCRRRGRAYRRPKSLPGRAPAVKRPSAPGYHPHRLRHGTESPTVEVSPAPLLPTRYFLLGEQHSSERPIPQRGPLFEQAFHFASTVP